MRIARISSLVWAIALPGVHAGAQEQPPTIPTIVAVALNPDLPYLGKPRFVNGRLPDGWPSTLIPSGATILGGGVEGDTVMFRIRVAVFEFSGPFDMRDVLRTLVTQAGYERVGAVPAETREGGFVETPPATLPDKYCNGGRLVGFGPVDSVQAPRVFSINSFDGPAARQNCTPQGNAPGPRPLPIKIPTMIPPAGALVLGNNTSWGSSSGTATSSIRITMPADSVLAHYARQLVAGGWKAAGRSAAVDGVAVQRFSFREGTDDWTATLIVLATGDRRDLQLQFAMKE